MKTLGLTLVVLALLVSSAGAGSVIPVSATASSTIGSPFNRIADHVRNASGLVGDQHGTAPDGSMWLTTNSPSTTAATMTFDMGGSFRINGFHLWNYNEVGPNFPNRGAKDVLVSTSLDGATYSAPVPMVFRRATGAATYAGADYAMPAVDARYVKFDIQNNFGGANADTVGLSEIRFATETSIASDMLRPMSASASSTIGGNFSRKPSMTIDGSGLDAAGAHNTGTDGYVWNSNFQVPAWISFDLGAAVPLTGFHLWNYNEVGPNFPNRGIKSTDVQVSLDGVNYTSLGALSFTRAPGAAGYLGEDYSLGGPVLARYVKFDNAVNFGGASSDLVGLSEIRFATPSAITGVTAVGSSQYINGTDRRVASNLVDGSGMSGFALERAGNLINTTNRTMWLAAAGDSRSPTNIVGQTVTFDLGGDYELAATRIWNYNEGSGGYTSRGVKLLDIAVSMDGLDFTTLAGPSGGHFALNKATGAADYVLSDMLDLDNSWARFVRFTVVDYFGTNPSSDYVGLSEVRFYSAVPEPATLSAAAMALAALAGYVRRRRRPTA